jgi:hypothetical protein
MFYNLQYPQIHRHKRDGDVAANSLHSGQKRDIRNFILNCKFIREVLQSLISRKL